jgi:hypothetical protein
MSVLTLGVGIGDLALFKDLALFLPQFSYRNQLYTPFFNRAWEPLSPPCPRMNWHGAACLSNCHTTRAQWFRHYTFASIGHGSVLQRDSWFLGWVYSIMPLNGLLVRILQIPTLGAALPFKPFILLHKLVKLMK